MAIAYEAGAVLSDMEFVQFHPTALAVKGAPRFLLSEALRGEGGILRNIDLERFMKRYDEAQELAPRDIVARAIVSEMLRTKSDHVFLDMTKKNEEFLKHRFPLIYSTCVSYGLDLATDMAPVCPAAHYMMGGVKTDLWGRTSLAGLYSGRRDRRHRRAWRESSGEQFPSRGTGVRRAIGAGHDQRRSVHKRSKMTLPGSPAPKPGEKSASAALPKVEKSSPSALALKTIRDIMWTKVGILRSGKELAEALRHLAALDLPKTAKPVRADHELRNLHILATLIARSGLAREESRGSHYRSDFPYRDDEKFSKHSAVKKGDEIRFES